MGEEIWQPVPGYETYYEVSDKGNIRGLERIVVKRNGKKRLVVAREITKRKNNYGYWSVRLSKGGRTRTYFVHRLVALAFIPNPENLPIVNHLKGKDCNIPEELEWVNASLNAIHAYKTGLNNNQGRNHPFSVGIIDNRGGLQFNTIREFAAYYGLNYNTARNALNGQMNFPKDVDLSLESLIKIVA